MTDTYVYVFIPDLPPSINDYYVTNRQGRRVPTREAKAYVALVAEMTKEALRDYRRPWAIIQEWLKEDDTTLRVKLTRTLPDRRRRDADNVLKAVADGLEIATGVDDCRYEWLTNRKYEKGERAIELRLTTD